MTASSGALVGFIHGLVITDVMWRCGFGFLVVVEMKYMASPGL